MTTEQEIEYLRSLTGAESAEMFPYYNPTHNDRGEPDHQVVGHSIVLHFDGANDARLFAALHDQFFKPPALSTTTG